MSARRRGGRDRRHQQPRRGRLMMLRFDDAEFEALLDAAKRSGLTPSGYAAEVALAIANESQPPEGDPLREALVELMQARTQVRRFAVNVNQAMGVLHTTGEAPEWLARATDLTTRAVARLDAVTAKLARRLP
jgi:hypothetical protein